MTRFIVDKDTRILVIGVRKDFEMTNVPTITEKLRKVLDDLEKITDEVEMQNARDNTSNDDFKAE